MNYGKEIKTLCETNGITMSELAEKLGQSKQYISALVNGTIRLKYSMAVEIAKIFSLKPDDIFLKEKSINNGNCEEGNNG